MTRFRLPLLSLTLIVVLTACAGAAGPPTYTYAPAAAQSAAAQSAATSPTVSIAAVAPAASALVSASPAGPPTVSLTEWKVGVDGTIASGKTTILIKNSGAAPHELLIFKSDLDPTAYPVDAAGDIKEKGAGVTLVSDGDNIAPAGTQTRSVELAPGKYLFVCNIPGHFKQGMFTVVTIAS